MSFAFVVGDAIAVSKLSTQHNKCPDTHKKKKKKQHLIRVSTKDREEKIMSKHKVTTYLVTC